MLYSALRILVVFAFSAFLSACAFLDGVPVFGKIPDNERNNRGGYLDVSADQFLLANSPSMRAIRTYSVLASLSSIAVDSGLDQSQVQVVLAQMRTTARRLKWLRQCLEDQNKNACIFFDSRTLDAEYALYQLAITLTPIDEARTLVSNALMKASVTAQLIKIGERGVVAGLRTAAIYRDMLALYYKIYAEQFSGNNAGAAEFTAATVEVEQDGMVTRYGGEGRQLGNWLNLMQKNGDIRKLSYSVYAGDTYFEKIQNEIIKICQELAPSLDEDKRCNTLFAEVSIITS